MVNVVILGASGEVGQSLALLLKRNPLVTKLRLFDTENATMGVLAGPAKVEAYLPLNNGLKRALTGADIIFIGDFLSPQSGVTSVMRQDGLVVNTGTIEHLAAEISITAPGAFVLVVSSPVDSTIPIVADIFKKYCNFSPKRLLGASPLNAIWASTFLADILKDPSATDDTVIPVVGGYCGISVVPLLSQVSHPLLSKMSPADYKTLAKAVQTYTVRPTNLAASGVILAESIIHALKTQESVLSSGFVSLNADPAGGAALIRELGQEISFFSSTIEIGKEGVLKIHPLENITNVERELIQAALPVLATNIQVQSLRQIEPIRKDRLSSETEEELILEHPQLTPNPIVITNERGTIITPLSPLNVVVSTLTRLREKLCQLEDFRRPFLHLLQQSHADMDRKEIQLDTPADTVILNFFTQHWPELVLISPPDSDEGYIWGQTSSGPLAAEDNRIQVIFPLVGHWVKTVTDSSTSTKVQANQLACLFLAVVIHELAHRILVWWSHGRCKTPTQKPFYAEAGNYIENAFFGGVFEGWWHQNYIGQFNRLNEIAFGNGDELRILDTTLADRILDFSPPHSQLPLVDLTKIPLHPPPQLPIVRCKITGLLKQLDTKTPVQPRNLMINRKDLEGLGLVGCRIGGRCKVPLK